MNYDMLSDPKTVNVGSKTTAGGIGGQLLRPWILNAPYRNLL